MNISLIHKASDSLDMKLGDFFFYWLTTVFKNFLFYGLNDGIKFESDVSKGLELTSMYVECSFGGGRPA